MSDAGHATVQLAIARSRRKTLALAVLSCLFVTAGAWMVAEGATYLGLPTSVIGVAAIVCFGVALVFAVARLFDRRPGLVLSAAGFDDRSSGVAVGFVPWRDVRRLAVMSTMGTSYLAVFVEGAETYAKRGNLLQRVARRANLGSSGTPITITSGLLAISFDEMVRQFELAWMAAHRAHVDAAARAIASPGAATEHPA